MNPDPAVEPPVDSGKWWEAPCVHGIPWFRCNDCPLPTGPDVTREVDGL